MIRRHHALQLATAVLLVENMGKARSGGRLSIWISELIKRIQAAS